MIRWQGFSIRHLYTRTYEVAAVCSLTSYITLYTQLLLFMNIESK